MENGNVARLDGQPASTELSLCFGSVDDIEPRGRCSHKPLPWTPTHLVYVPTSRSIVVACDTSSDETTQDSHPPSGETSTPTGATPAPRCGTEEQTASLSTAASSRSTSRLRVFDADTLEERPGTRPLCLRPGVRVTGAALLPGPVGPLGAAASNRFARSVPAEAAAAVGGDVVAVACCSCAPTAEPEERFGGSGSHRPAAGVTTIVAAFEVVACGNGREAVGDDVELPRRTADGVVGGGRERDDDTHLAAIAASPEMAGAWFGLESLGKRFVAGSADDRIAILGWEGCEKQSIR